MKDQLTAEVSRAERKGPGRSARRLVGSLSTGAVMAAVAMLAVAPASSAAAGITMPNGLNERVCLDALTLDGHTVAQDARAQVWVCNGGAQQQW
ncbi:RICIN domain-containing protein [Nocardia sp. NPDC003979]